MGDGAANLTPIPSLLQQYIATQQQDGQRQATGEQIKVLQELMASSESDVSVPDDTRSRGPDHSVPHTQLTPSLRQDPTTLISNIMSMLSAATTRPTGSDSKDAIEPAAASGQQPALSREELLSFVSLLSTSLASLRSSSHSLSDSLKDERAAVAAARQQVDDARLALENARLEEGELREEIRREEKE